MSYPTTRRLARATVDEVEPLVDNTSDKDSNSTDVPRKEGLLSHRLLNANTRRRLFGAGRRRGWQTQPFDLLSASMNQSHFVLNLFSIIFFCVGCLLLLISTHQQVRGRWYDGRLWRRL